MAGGQGLHTIPNHHEPEQAIGLAHEKLVELELGKKQPLRPAVLQLVNIKSSLDRLALELLGGRFPSVDVEPYYRVAEAYIEEVTRRNKGYRRNMRGNSPLETLILLSMDVVASAYVLVSGGRDEGKVDRLLKDFETMVGDYLESIGLLNY